MFYSVLIVVQLLKQFSGQLFKLLKVKDYILLV